MLCVARIPRVKNNEPADALRTVVSQASVADTISFLLASRVPDLEDAVGSLDHADVFPELALHGGHGIVANPSRKRVRSCPGAE